MYILGLLTPPTKKKREKIIKTRDGGMLVNGYTYYKYVCRISNLPLCVLRIGSDDPPSVVTG